MRHNDANKPNKSTHCYCCRGTECCCQHHDDANLAHIHTKGSRFVVANPQHVDHPSIQQQSYCTHRNIWQHESHVAPRCRRQATKNPRIHLSHHIVVALQHERLHCGGQRCNGDTSQHERGRRTRTPECRANCVCERHCDNTTNECRNRHRVNGPRCSCVAMNCKCNRCAKPRTGRHAQQIRVDQWIAKHTLITGTSQRQHRPHQGRQRHTWSTNLPHDVPLCIGDTAVDRQQRQSIKQHQRHPPPRRPGWPK